MQTFLPLPDPADSARALDRRRLGKQRVETLQILRALRLPDYGWGTHPAVLMWSGHVPGLVAYGLAMVEEWEARGGRDSTRWKIAEFAPEALEGPVAMPEWIGDPDFHAAHRSSLIAKDEEHYAPQWPQAQTGLEAVWPQPAQRHEPPMEAPAGHRAWVIDGPILDDDSLLLPADAPAAQTPAQLRRRPGQLERLRTEAAPGETVIVPLAAAAAGGSAFAAEREAAQPGLDEPVLLGRLGAGEQTPQGVRREVQWQEVIPRSRLEDPWQLQRPRTVFPIRR